MRTIDADALIAHINECIDVQNDNWEFEHAIGLTVALECISDAPTIEPEQRKGEWVCFGMNKLCCLDCGEIAFKRKNYCANCGRKMSKEVRHFKCMDCGKIFNELMDICPHCGADMRDET